MPHPHPHVCPSKKERDPPQVTQVEHVWQLAQAVEAQEYACLMPLLLLYGGLQEAHRVLCVGVRTKTMCDVRVPAAAPASVWRLFSRPSVFCVWACAPRQCVMWSACSHLRLFMAAFRRPSVSCVWACTPGMLHTCIDSITKLKRRA